VGDELGDAAQWVRVVTGAIEFDDDRVDVAGLEAAGVADRLSPGPWSAIT
jgi:hypothetical protein